MDYDEQEEEILECIRNYEESPNKSEQVLKKIKTKLRLYEQELINNEAGDDRMEWISDQKRRVDKIHSSKQVETNPITVKQILHLGVTIDEAMKNIAADTEKAIEASTYIRIELDKQIEELDNLEDENKEFKKRVRRAKKGLKVIIARALMNKCTRFLLVLVILAIIGLIVVSILVDKGVINVG